MRPRFFKRTFTDSYIMGKLNRYDAPAAKRFFKNVLTSPHNQSPREITVDKTPAYPAAVQQLKDEKVMNQETLLRQQKAAIFD
ncbi:DDE domain-containing protein [Paenibacillus sp. yr247]|nr:DDE domain-containing protein [Paenibacillus sp. yr247]